MAKMYLVSLTNPDGTWTERYMTRREMNQINRSNAKIGRPKRESTPNFSGEDLKNWRKAHKITRKDLANRFSVSDKTIFNWENGLFAMPHDILDRITEK